MLKTDSGGGAQVEAGGVGPWRTQMKVAWTWWRQWWGETRSDSGCIWKVEPTGFASRLAEGGEREKS